MEEIALEVVLDAFRELEIGDGLVFVCECAACTWAHWPRETVAAWLACKIIARDVFEAETAGHTRYRIDVGQLTFCALTVCSNILKGRVDLYGRVTRLVWRIIELAKREARIKQRLVASDFTLMQWFAEWVDVPFPEEKQKFVLDAWAKSLLRTKILSLRQKQDGPPPERDTGHDTRAARPKSNRGNSNRDSRVQRNVAGA